MKLSDVELIPGIIIATNDPENIGRIKINAPKYFSSDMGEDNLPWVYPFSTYNGATFSTPLVQSKVWLLVDTSSYQLYWYIPFFEPDLNIRDLTFEADNVQVIGSNNTPKSNSLIYMSDNDGIMLSNNDNIINIGADGEISIEDSNNIGISINSESISIGDNQEYQDNLVQYTTLSKLLSNLSLLMQEASKLFESSPYTIHCAEIFRLMSSTINEALSDDNFKTEKLKAN